jgi:hypothetical protein
MENEREPIFSPIVNNNGSSNESLFSSKNIIIGVLLFLLILSVLGTTIFILLGNSIKDIADIILEFTSKLLSFFGYTTGTVINKTADVVGETAKTGIDIAQGTVYDVGNIIKSASQDRVDTNTKTSLDTALQMSPIPINPPKGPVPTPSENPIQKPISAGKNNWCLVGEYDQKRGCIEIKDQDKCLSGQVFPTQQMCLNPTLTTNV